MNTNCLAVLWTSADLNVAKEMVFLYTYNAKKRSWWDQVIFIIWGPSAKLLAENEELQKGIKDMMEVGIKVEACIVCAEDLGVADKLRSLGIDVKSMGTVLTDYIKRGIQVLSI
mgnify:CR=1 FL=1